MVKTRYIKDVAIFVELEGAPNPVPRATEQPRSQGPLRFQDGGLTRSHDEPQFGKLVARRPWGRGCSQSLRLPVSLDKGSTGSGRYHPKRHICSCRALRMARWSRGKPVSVLKISRCGLVLAVD